MAFSPSGTEARLEILGDTVMEPGPTIDSSDDEDQLASGSGRSPTSTGPPIAPASGASVKAASAAGASGSAAGGAVTRLGLHFNGGRGTGGRHPLSWRDGPFSDWTVQVGEKTYHLHAFLLARASFYFNSHMSMAAGGTGSEPAAGHPAVRCSDLTEVLPQSCHAAFEDALDFVYSENQAAFEVPASKALLLLKVADILGIGGLFEAMGQRISAAFSETAPLLMEQYCRVHVPGAEDGAALRQIRDEAVELLVRKFQPFLANLEMRQALVRLPGSVLAEILEADDLAVASEDVVFDFVAERLQAAEPIRSGGADRDSEALDNETIWQRVRWPHLSAWKFSQAITLGQQYLRPEMVVHALTARVAQADLGGSEAFASLSSQVLWGIPPRHAILPPGVPPPLSTELDFCFHYTGPDQFACGESIRSQPKRIGDVVLRVLVFPSGTDTGVARGSLSVFLEAVPQLHWPRDWEFANIRYAIACYRWPTGSGETWAAKRKGDLWTFKANRLDRGWHDFLSPGEVHRYLGPEGFVCIRGGIEPECLPRCFLLGAHSHTGAPGPGSELSGSSASRRSWAPRTAGPVGATE